MTQAAQSGNNELPPEFPSDELVVRAAAKSEQPWIGAVILDLYQQRKVLLAEIEELKVRDIVSRNPGIDPDEVRRFRKTGVR